jgi:hypothetical protein
MSGSRAATVHRLLRAILPTAVDDGMIKRNPCRITGADKETEHARPVATVRMVHALGDAVPPGSESSCCSGRSRVSGWDELVNVRRMNIDSNMGVVEVRHAERAGWRERVAMSVWHRAPFKIGAGCRFPLVETRGIEPLTPALQRRCSAN